MNILFHITSTSLVHQFQHRAMVAIHLWILFKGTTGTCQLHGSWTAVVNSTSIVSDHMGRRDARPWRKLVKDIMTDNPAINLLSQQSANQ